MNIATDAAPVARSDCYFWANATCKKHCFKQCRFAAAVFTN